jgi:hypothetical protein
MPIIKRRFNELERVDIENIEFEQELRHIYYYLDSFLQYKRNRGKCIDCSYYICNCDRDNEYWFKMEVKQYFIRRHHYYMCESQLNRMTDQLSYLLDYAYQN